VGQHLGAEADRQQRDVPSDDLADEGRLGVDQRSDVGPIDVPLRAEREHQLHAFEARPGGGILPDALDEGVATLPESVADEPRVEGLGVPDDQRAHGPQRTVAAVRLGR
jgi:hypothetical protein